MIETTHHCAIIAESPTLRSMRSVELFSGGGGLALGLHKAGFHHEFMLEFVTSACNTLRHNVGRGAFFPSAPDIHEVDIRDFSFPDSIGAIELLAGGPPCQPFSQGGKHRGPLDKRDMFPQVRRFLSHYQPKAFILENVKGLTRPTFSLYVDFILLMLSMPEVEVDSTLPWEEQYLYLKKNQKSAGGLKYNIKTKLLNALHYGVPQSRERFFFVGIRSDIGIEYHFPQPTHSLDELLKQQLLTGQYWDERGISPNQFDLDNLKSKGRRNLNKATNQQELIPLLPAVTMHDALSDLPAISLDSRGDDPLQHIFKDGCRLYAGHSGSYIHLPSKTLKAGVHGVPGGENNVVFSDGTFRYLSVREGARIQTFPDDYFFHGAWTVCFKQIGNGVPVNLANAMGKSVYSHIYKSSDASPSLSKSKSSKSALSNQLSAA